VSLPASDTPPSPALAPVYHLATLVYLTSPSSLLSTGMPTTLAWMVGSSGASTKEGK
jgi:hypothetical protein